MVHSMMSMELLYCNGHIVKVELLVKILSIGLYHFLESQSHFVLVTDLSGTTLELMRIV